MGRGSKRSLRFAVVLALVGALAGVFVASALALRFDDASCKDQDPCKPATGVVGMSYQHKLTGEGGNGPPFTYILKTGSLPPGTSLNSSTGLISGTPTASGTAHFGVELQDKSTPAPDWCVTRGTCSYQEFTIVILSGIIINNQTAKGGTIGQAYSEQLTATNVTSLNPPSGPQANATWSLNSGTLPPGVTLSASGLLSGTPTAEGSYQFVVRAALDGSRFDTETLTIVVRQPLAITAPKPLEPSATLNRWEVGVPFSAKLAATGGSGTYTWSIATGTLPTGFALGADGTVSGTTSTAGSSQATLRLTDTEGRTADFAANFLVAARVTVSTLALKAGKVGRLYRAKVASAGGLLPKVWKIVKGPLPRGVRFDRATGVLSGKPTKAGRYRVTFQVTDGLKVVAKKTLRIDVLAAPR